MTSLFEHPLPILFVGISVLGVAGLFWHATRHRAAAIVMVLSLLITAALLLIERLVVTDREAIAQTLHEIAGALERNDVDAVIGYVSNTAPQLSREARAAMAQAVIEKVSIKWNLKVDLSPRRADSARATFNVVVTASDRQGLFQSQAVPRVLVVTFHKEAGQWRVASYEHHPPYSEADRYHRGQ